MVPKTVGIENWASKPGPLSLSPPSHTKVPHEPEYTFTSGSHPEASGKRKFQVWPSPVKVYHTPSPSASASVPQVKPPFGLSAPALIVVPQILPPFVTMGVALAQRSLAGPTGGVTTQGLVLPSTKVASPPGSRWSLSLRRLSVAPLLFQL